MVLQLYGEHGRENTIRNHISEMSFQLKWVAALLYTFRGWRAAIRFLYCFLPYIIHPLPNASERTNKDASKCTVWVNVESNLVNTHLRPWLWLELRWPVGKKIVRKLLLLTLLWVCECHSFCLHCTNHPRKGKVEKYLSEKYPANSEIELSLNLIFAHGCPVDARFGASVTLLMPLQSPTYCRPAWLSNMTVKLTEK